MLKRRSIKVCNVADLPGGRSAMLQTFRGEGLQGGRSAIQHRHRYANSEENSTYSKPLLILGTILNPLIHKRTINITGTIGMHIDT